ncbi:TlpA family protein disulfide reductase [Skermania piniformis]|uniref:TlpA family protein disulfide reductase n=1 Tax=Skermania pinensis TaxID=39122 RepID=A0ABX8SCT3_9ACTN|nr:TlpA disulfide reductase family protein [Skermania piniformis]QXQ15613.1 TlpA family protein disulfide reductase [Skermania piniformis]
MSRSGQVGLALLVVVVALIVALWPRSGDPDGGHDVRAGTASRGAVAEDPAELSAARATAALAPCPARSSAPVSAHSPLQIELSCLADGAPIELAAALAGRPALLNVWAYWCTPCAEELPLLQEFADRSAGITVLTVHFDPAIGPGLARLAALDVHLPGVQDGARRLDAAVDAPAVLPYSVLVRSDGTVARVLARPFRDVDDIAATVRDILGVTA